MFPGTDQALYFIGLDRSDVVLVLDEIYMLYTPLIVYLTHSLSRSLTVYVSVPYCAMMVFWCSYEDVVSSVTLHHRSINMEIVRRGALILFCDYVVCTCYAVYCHHHLCIYFVIQSIDTVRWTLII